MAATTCQMAAPKRRDSQLSGPCVKATNLRPARNCPYWRMLDRQTRGAA